MRAALPRTLLARGVAVVAIACLGVLGSVAGYRTVTAAPNVTWFGGVTHGPREGGMVALTFDDGLNGETTRAVAATLEAHRAVGTFFIVGGTLPAQAGLARDLEARGHVLANHSQDHATASLLAVGYDDAARAQATFATTLGHCPRFFRPPHGVHTPAMLRAVRRDGMQLVNWDVEVRDWAATDPAHLAQAVLAAVRPGSIVLLHDGTDGVPGADRDVVVRALPAILDGLQARGLRPVGLDTLLGTTATLDACPAR